LFASMSAEVAFCVLRPSGRQSQQHAGTDYSPTRNQTGGKKKGLAASTVGDALLIPIDFRLSLAPQHNPRRLRKTAFASRTLKTPLCYHSAAVLAACGSRIFR
jgi:hypothetical protein